MFINTSTKKWVSILALTMILITFSLKIHHVQAASAGDILINEIMQNPNAVYDSAGEWFEILNTTSSPIDIEGWIIKDDDTDSHTINNSGSGVIVPANSFFVLCRDSNSSTNGGFICDYQYSGFTLANGADEVVIMEGATEIDRVNYDGGTLWPDPTGASMAYNVPDSGNPDNNIGANWYDSGATDGAPQAPQYGNGDRGTPGSINHDWMDGLGGRPTAVTLLNFQSTTTTWLPIALAGMFFASILLIIRRRRTA